MKSISTPRGDRSGIFRADIGLFFGGSLTISSRGFGPRMLSMLELKAWVKRNIKRIEINPCIGIYDTIFCDKRVLKERQNSTHLSFFRHGIQFYDLMLRR